MPNLSDPSIDVNRFWRELESDPSLNTRTLTSFPGQHAFGLGLVFA